MVEGCGRLGEMTSVDWRVMGRMELRLPLERMDEENAAGCGLVTDAEAGRCGREGHTVEATVGDADVDGEGKARRE